MATGCCSSWKEATSGVPQGSVLVLVHDNDLPEGIRPYFSMFADDTKLVAKTGDVKDYETPQGTVDVPAAWQVRWMILFNQSKCRVLRMEKGSGRPRRNYN